MMEKEGLALDCNANATIDLTESVKSLERL